MANPQPQGFLATPPGGKGSGVLVLHAWWGLNETIKAFCNRLADAGFVAFAPDLYHGKIADDIPDAEALMRALKKSRAGPGRHHCGNTIPRESRRFVQGRTGGHRLLARRHACAGYLCPPTRSTFVPWSCITATRRASTSAPPGPPTLVTSRRRTILRRCLYRSGTDHPRACLHRRAGTDDPRRRPPGNLPSLPPAPVTGLPSPIARMPTTKRPPTWPGIAPSPSSRDRRGMTCRARRPQVGARRPQNDRFRARTHL